MSTKISLLLVALFLQGCASYKYAQKVKMISFDDNLKKGKSVGPIRGEDCTWKFLGYDLGGAPTVDKAFINAKDRASSLESAGFGALSSSKGEKPMIRYVNNVSTENTGFNAVVIGKNCITVTGNGYL